ncbi:MAG TPA: xyloglucanase [Candidatus Dormibacteraeota bacterium]|nr:xyloglucanase [Candidatus Dormibacteraeota bacterium]
MRRVLLVALAVALVGSAALAGVTAAAGEHERQAYTWRNAVTGGGGGYVPGIVFNTKQPGLAFARTDIGGAYRWDPSSGRWVQLLSWVGPDDWNLSGVESIATDPVNPDRLVLAVGTYTNVFTSQNGAIMRSTDQGRTFKTTMLPFKNGGNMPGRSMGERLNIDPNDDRVIYFGARSGNGLWRSTDFGATWSQVTSFTAVGDYVEQPGNIYAGDPDGIVWEAFDATSGSRRHASQSVFVGVATKNGPSIWHSADGGATWAAVPGQPVGFLPQHGIWSNGALYISYSNGAGPFDGSSGDVWKLDTTTGAWTRISPVPSTDTANDYFGYGGLTIDQQHPNTIMVAALNSWFPDTIFFRTTDGGATWTRIWDFTSYPNRSFRFSLDASAAPWLDFGVKDPTPPSPQVKLGWMVSALAIDPFNSDHLFYGTGATIFGTSDLTNWDKGTPVHIAVAAKGVEETAVQDLVSPPAGAHLLSALGDIGGFRHDDLTQTPAEMFTNPVFGTTTSLDFAGRAPSVVVRAGNGGSSAAAFSADGGTTWTPAATQPAGVNGGGMIALGADGARTVWSPSGAPVSFSADDGATWTASAGIPAGAQVRSDRVDASRFYGLSNGTLFVSTDGGATFSASPATGLPTSAKFNATPGRAGDVWVAGDPGGLWHSTDGGMTFAKLSSITMADNIGFGKAAPQRSYPALFTSGVVGGVHALFRSDDAGASWVRINDDQHQFASTNQAITGDPRIFGRVYVTTNGFGIVYGDVRGDD